MYVQRLSELQKPYVFQIISLHWQNLITTWVKAQEEAEKLELYGKVWKSKMYAAF